LREECQISQLKKKNTKELTLRLSRNNVYALIAHLPFIVLLSILRINKEKATMVTPQYAVSTYRLWKWESFSLMVKKLILKCPADSISSMTWMGYQMLQMPRVNISKFFAM
jgi:hypothetical protein